jgi:hypothetical protein
MPAPPVCVADGAHRNSPGVLVEIPHPRAVVTVAVFGGGHAGCGR